MIVTVEEMYYCSATRPGIEGKTMEDTKEVKTETLDITAAPLPQCTISGTEFLDGSCREHQSG